MGGLLNATLGNLTELVIALAALRAGQYTLVRASIAGAIVTNTLFVLGMSFLAGRLKHHVQEYNRAGTRFQAGLLFLTTVALLAPSAGAVVDSAARTALAQTLSVGIALGAASQIALFVTPVMVLPSYVIGPAPMDLQFWPTRW